MPAVGVRGEAASPWDPAYGLTLPLCGKTDPQDDSHSEHLAWLPPSSRALSRTEAARGVGRFPTPITPPGDAVVQAD
jgi:hypothetical protein